MAERLKALSNPNRLRIFLQLVASNAGLQARSAGEAGAPCCVGDLGEELSVAPSTVSHHIKELRQAGLIGVERRGQNIDCRVEPDAVRALADFFNLAAVQCCGTSDSAARGCDQTARDRNADPFRA